MIDASLYPYVERAIESPLCGSDERWQHIFSSNAFPDMECIKVALDGYI